jgi:hypothetical protein
MKIGVSTTGTAESDFTFISNYPYEEVPLVWTKFSYDMSAYAGQEVYLAINCVSNDIVMLMIDDISVDYADKSSRSLSGYDIYLDGNYYTTVHDTECEFTDLTNGNHTAGVKAVYSSGGETDIITIDFATDCDEMIRDNQLSGFILYPNPAKDELRITNYELRDGNIAIYDLTGRLVLMSNNLKVSESNDLIIDVSSLPAGVYMIKLIESKNVSTQRFVIKR